MEQLAIIEHLEAILSFKYAITKIITTTATAIIVVVVVIINTILAVFHSIAFNIVNTIIVLNSNVAMNGDDDAAVGACGDDVDDASEC